ncbi:MAG: hypothetical protein OXF72_08935 [Gammaproteobacteria bacterium]|nr:hypothetical protein [Gammaproteobacteria bacterium]MCY4198924.1 hypothetical protein [Gammaproteobacteria bacterium]MCY4323626.1 hypothetical protein [Gammaproteobacteria bacterium]
MNRTLLVIVRSGLDRRLYVREAIDAALVCAAFDMQVSVMFEGDGAAFSHAPYFAQLFESGAPEDFARICTSAPTSAAHAEALSSDEAIRMIATHQHILVA